jgi:ABC-2 type transport system permease protein
LLLAGGAGAAGWLAFRVALAGATDGGEGGAAGVPRRASRAGPLALAGPLLEKELRFLARHPVLRLYVLLLPAIAGAVGWRLSTRPGAIGQELAAALPVLGFALYVQLVTQPFWLNAFAWDRGGARLLFLAPVAPADVLRAKNRAAVVAAAVLAALCGAAAALAGAAPPAWALAGAIALHAGVTPFLHGLGNVVSIVNPRAAAFGAQRAGRLAPLSALAGLAIVSATVSVFALPVLAATRLENPWILAGGWAALGVAGYGGYRATLPRAAALLVRRREELLAEVCGDDA